MPPAQPPSRPRRPRRPRNTLQSFLLALAMHGLLFAALWFAVQWHTVSDSPAQAELWNVPPPPAIVTPETPPPPPPPPVVSAEPPKPDAEIVEQQQKAKPVPEPTPPPPEPVKPPPKPEPPPKEPPPPQPVKPPPEPVKPPPEPPKKPPEPKRDVQREKLEEKLRQQEIERTLAGAGPSTNSTSPKAGGGGRSNPGYEAQVTACIKPQIIFDVNNAPPDIKAEFSVELLPDGSQSGPPKLTKSSGVPAWDAAVERAIRRCDPFPRPNEGEMPRTLTFGFRPTD